MPVIDAHVHVLPNFAPMAPWEDLGRVDRLLHRGVDKAVVLPVVAEYSPGNNQECAQWGREHPDRLACIDGCAHARKRRGRAGLAGG